MGKAVREGTCVAVSGKTSHRNGTLSILVGENKRIKLPMRDVRRLSLGFVSFEHM